VNAVILDAIVTDKWSRISDASQVFQCGL